MLKSCSSWQMLLKNELRTPNPIQITLLRLFWPRLFTGSLFPETELARKESSNYESGDTILERIKKGRDMANIRENAMMKVGNPGRKRRIDQLIKKLPTNKSLYGFLDSMLEH